MIWMQKSSTPRPSARVVGRLMLETLDAGHELTSVQLAAAITPALVRNGTALGGPVQHAVARELRELASRQPPCVVRIQEDLIEDEDGRHLLPVHDRWAITEAGQHELRYSTSGRAEQP